MITYIVELGRTDGYIFDEEETYVFFSTEQESAIQKYESLSIAMYQYKAMYEEENGKKKTVKFAIYKISNTQAKIVNTYFISYVYIDYIGNLQFDNNCFEIDDNEPLAVIKRLEQMCNRQAGSKCAIINYKKIDGKE